MRLNRKVAHSDCNPYNPDANSLKNHEKQSTANNLKCDDLEAFDPKASGNAHAASANDQKYEDIESVNTKTSESYHAGRSFESTKGETGIGQLHFGKGKEGETDAVYDPVSLAHMRLNRKEIYGDCNPPILKPFRLRTLMVTAGNVTPTAIPAAIKKTLDQTTPT